MHIGNLFSGSWCMLRFSQTVYLHFTAWPRDFDGVENETGGHTSSATCNSGHDWEHSLLSLSPALREHTFPAMSQALKVDRRLWSR